MNNNTNNTKRKKKKKKKKIFPLVPLKWEVQFVAQEFPRRWLVK